MRYIYIYTPINRLEAPFGATANSASVYKWVPASVHTSYAGVVDGDKSHDLRPNYRHSEVPQVAQARLGQDVHALDDTGSFRALASGIESDLALI